MEPNTYDRELSLRATRLHQMFPPCLNVYGEKLKERGRWVLTLTPEDRALIRRISW